MSLSDWSSGILSQRTSQKAGPPEPKTALTLSDWLQKKKDDFRPENRFQSFTKQAEEALNNDNFEDAIVLFSKAIELSPTDSLYANRAHCHRMVKRFDLCLSDAQKAIEMSEESANKRQKTSKDTNKDYFKYRNKLMYYSKAKALRHMKRFQESIDALVLSKTLAIECKFIDDEIKDIKLQVICDLGYDRPDVEEMSNKLDSIEELIKTLRQTKQLMAANDSADQLPSNPFGYRGLYVNGLVADLEDKALEELLSSCGELLRCKVYSNGEQSRAIIAFFEGQAVREAIRTIRSNKEIIRDQSIDNLVFRYRHNCVDGISDLRSDPQISFKGTEIGGECFKWRTIGCEDKDCKALHIPLCRHLDQQSIETKCIERKRQPIVFESTPKAESTPLQSKRIKSSDKQRICFDTNGTESEGTPLSLTSPSKRLKNSTKTPIVFDIEDNESQTQTKDLRLESSDRKLIKLKTSSQTETNGLTSTPNTSQTKRSERKLIVFDIKDYDKPKETATDACLEGLKTIKVRPLTPPNGRNISSYDDLFD